MKTIRTKKQPADPAWTLIVTEYPVPIRYPGGAGSPEVVPVEVEAWRAGDGEIIIPGDVKAALEDLKARYFGLLLPRQLRELRASLGLTQKQISELLQLGEKTWTRWETGKERPSRSMNILLRALKDGRIDLAYLNLLRAPIDRKRSPAKPFKTRPIS